MLTPAQHGGWTGDMPSVGIPSSNAASDWKRFQGCNKDALEWTQKTINFPTYPRYSHHRGLINHVRGSSA